MGITISRALFLGWNPLRPGFEDLGFWFCDLQQGLRAGGRGLRFGFGM